MFFSCPWFARVAQIVPPTVMIEDVVKDIIATKMNTMNGAILCPLSQDEQNVVGC